MTGAFLQALYDEARDDTGPSFQPIPTHSLLDLIARRMIARDSLVDKCESPIEVWLGTEILARLEDRFSENGITLVPQFRWKSFRADFAIVRDRAILFIECDGREFHSTEEQRASDERKDRAAESIGIPVLRFTGTDIFLRPEMCVDRIKRTIWP